MKEEGDIEVTYTLPPGIGNDLRNIDKLRKGSLLLFQRKTRQATKKFHNLSWLIDYI